MNEPLQFEIQTFIDRAVADGRERGVQVAIYQHGKLIVDAVSGFTSPAASTKVTSETIFPVFSVSKGITATLIHRLIQQGAFGLHQTICSLWPEFGVKGKETITVWDVLSHSAGLAYLPPEITPAEAADWSKMMRLMEQLTPAHVAGTERIYHALTYGWILGGMAERATGKSYNDLLSGEILEPLKLESLFIGMPENASREIAQIEMREPEATVDGTTPQSVPASLRPLGDLMNQPLMQRACLPGASGLMSARDMARHYAATLPGGVDGVELLTETQRKIALEGDHGMLPGMWLLGYSRFDGLDRGPARIYGHGGHGGARGVAYLDKRAAVGFTHNAFGPEMIAEELFALIQDRLNGESHCS